MNWIEKKNDEKKEKKSWEKIVSRGEESKEKEVSFYIIFNYLYLNKKNWKMDNSKNSLKC